MRVREDQRNDVGAPVAYSLAEDARARLQGGTASCTGRPMVKGVAEACTRFARLRMAFVFK